MTFILCDNIMLSMKDNAKASLKKFGMSVPLWLLPLLCTALLGGGALLFVYSVIITVAWRSAMAFLVLFAAAMLAVGAGIGCIEGFKKYVPYFKNKTSMTLDKKPEAETKTDEPAQTRTFKKYVSLGNAALAIMLIGSLLAVVSSFLGSMERDNWVAAKSEYMLKNGYYEDLRSVRLSYPISQNTEDIHKITINLIKKNAAVIYDDGISGVITITGYSSYEHQLAAYVSDGVLKIEETEPPKLDGTLEKMLFFLFDESHYEGQIQITVPEAYRASIEIIGEYVEAKK